MKKTNPILIFVGVAALVLAGSVAMMIASKRVESKAEFPASWFEFASEDEQAAQDVLVGKPMPLLDLSDWQNGERKPEALKGKVVVVDFWTTWCPPCIAAFPDNNRIYAQYKDRGLEFIGVCTNFMQEKWQPILAEKQPLYPNARDEKMNTMNAWNAKTYPTYAVVDRKGIVRAISLKHEFIEKVVEKLLAESAL